jgi:hypothetical protein
VRSPRGLARAERFREPLRELDQPDAVIEVAIYSTLGIASHPFGTGALLTLDLVRGPSRRAGFG